tara:strand:+ start:1359 stop:1577 length:219 start_codon:yes stop_codon:yes gene_type:complete
MVQFSKTKGSKENLVQPSDEDIEKVLKTFRHFGGSWENIFKGGIRDMVLLKKIIKVGVKKKMFSLAPTWDRV